MATAMRYVGPDGQVNRDVGAETGEGDELEPGQVYEVSAELADRLANTAMWERVKDFDQLPLRELRKLAAERGVEGASRMDKDAVVAALRGEDATASVDEGGEGA